MRESLRALLTSAFDFAGMLAPTSLGMQQAVAELLEYRARPAAWMLGRFVCPITRLEEFAHCLADFAQQFEAPADALPLRLAAALDGGMTHEAAEAALLHGLDVLEQFGIRECLESVEGPLPALTLEGLAETHLADWLSRMTASIGAGAGTPGLFFDMPFNLVHRAGESADEAKQRHKRFMQRLWTAGATQPFGLRFPFAPPAVVPTPAMAAAMITWCCDSHLAWKGASGLQRPLFHTDDAEAVSHGFVNVLVAAVLAESHRLTLGMLEEVIRCVDSDAFKFDDEQLAWGGLEASIEQIERCRQRRLVSTATWDLDATCDSLRGLGWM